jgi:DNA-binding transcriptional LysR family regulator
MKRRVVEVHVDGRVTVNERAIAVKAAIEGVGLIQLPLPYVTSDLAAGNLVPVLGEWAPPPPDPFYLYYPSRRQNRPALKALVDFLVATDRDASRKGTTSAAGAKGSSS